MSIQGTDNFEEPALATWWTRSSDNGMMMKRRFGSFLIALLVVQSAPAQNLVPNGGFEMFSVLPNNFGQTNRATGWNNVNGTYVAPPSSFASPDFYHTGGSVPNAFGQIAPFSGNGQMGFATFVFFIPGFREYISTTLVSPLVPGTQYQVSFALTNGNNGDYSKSTNNIGVCFSPSPLFQLVNQPIPAVPQVEIATVVYHPNFWQTYTFFYTATSAFTRITIGNFRDDANTLQGFGGASGAYYFIDEVVVQAVTILPIELLAFTGRSEHGRNILEWTTASEIDNAHFDVQRSAEGLEWETFATVAGAGTSQQRIDYTALDHDPFQLTYYRLKQVDFDGTSTVSNVIALRRETTVGEMLLFPNPATTELNVALPDGTGNMLLSIIAVDGRIVHERMVFPAEGQTTLAVDVRDLPAGAYSLVLRSENATVSGRWIKAVP